MSPPPLERQGARSRRSLLTWLVTGANAFLGGFIGLWVTPLLLRHLGAERLGAFRALAEAFGYLALLDLGLLSALGVFILRARASGEDERAAGLGLLGFRRLASLCALCSPVVLGLVLFAPARLTGSLGASEVEWACWLLALTFFLLPAGVFRTRLETAQRGYLVGLALMGQSLLVPLLSVTLALAGAGVAGLAGAALAGNLLFVLLTAWWCRGDRHAPAPQDPPGWSALFRIGVPMWLARLASRATLVSDAVVLAACLDLHVVFALQATQALLRLAGGLLSAVSSATWAGLVEVELREGAQALGLRLAELTRLTLGAGIAVLGATAALTPAFVARWVGTDHYAGAPVVIMSVVQILLVAHFSIFSTLLDAQGRTAGRLPVSLLGAVIKPVAALLLIPHVGLEGVLVANLVAIGCTEVWFNPFLVTRLSRVPVRPLLAATARGLLTGTPAAVLGWMFLPDLAEGAGWGRLIGLGGVTGALALGYTWLVVFSREDRAAWRRRLGRAES